MRECSVKRGEIPVLSPVFTGFICGSDQDHYIRHEYLNCGNHGVL